MNHRRIRTSAPFLVSLVIHSLLGLIWSLFLWNDLPRADESAIAVDWVLTTHPRPTPRVQPPQPRTIEESFDRTPLVRQMNEAFRERQTTPKDFLPKELLRIETPIHIPLESVALDEGVVAELGSASLRGLGDASTALGHGTRGNGSEMSRPVPNLRPGPAPGARTSFVLGNETQVEPDAPPPTVKNPLLTIADNLASRQRETNKIDIVFLLDASQSMQDNIYAVERHLEKMVARLFASGLDYRVGVVTFRHTALTSVMGNDLKVSQPTQDIKSVRKTLSKVECSGGEKALDAIIESVKRVKFRGDAARHFVLVTDEYVEGSFTAREVLGALYRAKIQMDVIGKDEPFQRLAAAETGGVWILIDNLEG